MKNRCKYKYAEFAGICPKIMFMISKKRSITMAYAEKMQHRHPPIQEHLVYSHLDFIYLFKIYIEFISFRGICCGGILTLQKTRFGGPGKPSFWSVLDYGILRVFMGSDEFLQVFDGFSTGCGEAASSKTWFCWLKPVFFAETSSKPGVDTSTRFFQGFG